MQATVRTAPISIRIAPLLMPSPADEATYRILDASANRAAEGLRCLEEFARFARDDASLTAELKQLRHELAAAMGRLDRLALLSARNTAGDVGTSVRTPTEYARCSTQDVVAAATSRTQQAMRCLEEYSKTLDVEVAGRIEQIRYRFYDLAAQAELAVIAAPRHEQLRHARLYVLIDAQASEEAFAANVRRLASGGVDILQLRDRGQADRVLYQRARLGTAIAREHQTLFIVNDRADLAVAADADGVHVGQDELPAEAARQIVGRGRLVGISTHSLAQAREAVANGADYIGCGPVFAGTTKQFDAYVGTELLNEIANEIDLPAFAIGGIDRQNIPQVIAAGFRRIAVTGAIRDATDATAAIRALQQQLRADEHE